MDIYKEDPIDQLLEDIERRHQQARFDVFQEQNREELTEEEQKSSMQPKSREIFHIKQFLERTQAQCSTLVNFTLQELSHLKKLVSPYVTLGRNCGIGLKSRIFVALFAFANNQTYPEMQVSLGLKHSTISIIVSQCIRSYFPIWAHNFIQSCQSAKYFRRTQDTFQNFPWCVGAVDTTTIAFLRPQSKQEQSMSWDAKNHVNGRKLEVLVDPSGQAIYANANFLAATHDKRIFDESGIIQFITQEGKAGTCNVLGVIADKGYQGIKQVSPASVLMAKGSTPQIIEYNKSVAADRQIVERWNCRFKMSWGMMHDVYRGDRSKLPIIIMGLTALTNYHIQLHPLNNDDDPMDDKPKDEEAKKINDQPKTSPSPIQPQIKSITPTTPTPVPPSNAPQSQNTPKCSGIQNQGSTCHLNAAIQLLFSIPEAREVIEASAIHQLTPSLQLHQVFSTLKRNSGAASTKELTDVLGDEWLHERSIDESLFELMDKINENRQNYSAENSFAELFWIALPNGEKLRNIVYLPFHGSIIDAMKRFITAPGEKIRFSSLISILCARGPQSSDVYHFAHELDLSEISDGPNPYKLVGVVGYAHHHLIYLKCVDDQWYILNDEKCETCSTEQVLELQGGKEWVAALLLYAAPGYKVL